MGNHRLTSDPAAMFERRAIRNDDGGGFRSMFVAQCSSCGAEGMVPNPRESTGHSFAVTAGWIVQRFAHKGWLVNRKRKLCPACTAPADLILSRSATAMQVEAAMLLQGMPPSLAAAAADAASARMFEPTPEDDMGKPMEKTTLAVIERPADPAPTAALPEPDAATRRRIWRAIDDNWNEATGRYQGDASDRSLAKTLDIPPAWVEAIRRAEFGEIGGNDEVEELRAAIDAAISRQEAAAEEILRRAAEMEIGLSELRNMRKRLDRVEAAFIPKR